MSEVKMEIYGMAELIDKLNKYHDAPNRVGNKALREAGKIMLDTEKTTLLQMHKKDRATGQGAAELNMGRIKVYSGGSSRFLGVGFTKEKMGDWDKIKGAYMQHYGYHEHRSGKYFAGSNWLGVAFDRSSSKCYEIIKSVMLAELNKIK